MVFILVLGLGLLGAGLAARYRTEKSLLHWSFRTNWKIDYAALAALAARAAALAALPKETALVTLPA